MTPRQKAALEALLHEMTVHPPLFNQTADTSLGESEFYYELDQHIVDEVVTAFKGEEK